MNLNVFNWSYTKRYYLTHPWRWIKELWWSIKAAYRRARYGWCYCDVWNWDDWFCSVVPPMLRHMADHGSAYPGSEPFDTPEKWHAWLHKMADTIERLNYDDWMEDLNEYSEDYEKSFDEHPNLTMSNSSTLPKEELRRKYYERCKEIHKMRPQVLEEFGKEFFKHFDCLWD